MSCPAGHLGHAPYWPDGAKTELFRAVPAEVRPYLTELVRRTRAVCGPRLTGMVAVGSLVLGNYWYGRSDIDVTVVVEGPPPAAVLRELADALDHRRLPCPAAGLELVVYAADFACPVQGCRLPAGSQHWRSAAGPGRLRHGRGTVVWYVIDRSVAHQDGNCAVRAVRIGGDRFLNGCRSVVYCRTGRWLAKRDAAGQVAAAEEDLRPLIEAAARSFERPRTAVLSLPGPQARAFLAWVRARVDETPRRSAPDRALSRRTTKGHGMP